MPAKQPDSDTIALGQTVATLRQAREWHQADLASALSQRLNRPIDPTLVTRLESGRRKTSVGELSALAAILGVPIAALADPTDAFYSDGFDEWRAQVRLIAARETLEAAARRYGEARFHCTSERDEVEDAAAIAARGEQTGWNTANGEH